MECHCSGLERLRSRFRRTTPLLDCDELGNIVLDDLREKVTLMIAEGGIKYDLRRLVKERLGLRSASTSPRRLGDGSMEEKRKARSFYRADFQSTQYSSSCEVRGVRANSWS
jgi:hypothetical protein